MAVSPRAHSLFPELFRDLCENKVEEQTFRNKCKEWGILDEDINEYIVSAIKIRTARLS